MKLKESLGQNFFNNPNLAKKITDLILETKPNFILEIGPGDGYFTKLIHKECKNLLIIEKDTVLAANLRIKFPEINVINEDFLKFENSIVFGSLPYNIAKPIIKILLESNLFENMFFILQKEVAQKYVGKSKSSLLSITTKAYVDSKILFDINSGSFLPRPKVTSSFVHFTRNKNIKLLNIETFNYIVKSSFSSPRKTLRNNLKGIQFTKKVNSEIFNKRAEDLSYNDYVYLSKCYNQKQ